MANIAGYTPLARIYCIQVVQGSYGMIGGSQIARATPRNPTQFADSKPEVLTGNEKIYSPFSSFQAIII